jgi:antitoxin MazE
VKTQLSRWGNSLAVRIPKPVAEAAKLRAGDALVVEVEDSGAVKIRKPINEPTLAELVRGITPENRHTETCWGQPVGNELW